MFYVVLLLMKNNVFIFCISIQVLVQVQIGYSIYYVKYGLSMVRKVELFE